MVSICPLPPADIHRRKLVIREVNLASVDLIRIHRRAYGPIFYTRKSTGGTQNRFDAFADEFGVMYTATTFEAAFLETVVRGRFAEKLLPLQIDESDLTERAASRLGSTKTGPLRLADFTASLVGLGGDATILSIPDYNATNKWSSAVYGHPENVDGILYQSRYSNLECIAVFDKTTLVERDVPVPLDKHLDLPRILDQYMIGIAPSSGTAWKT